MSSTINRLALVAGSVLAGGILGVLAMSTAAHADDKPAQQPGGVLGTVETVVDQVTPDEPKPEPTKDPAPPAEPEPEHSEEPAAEPEPTEPAEHAPAEAPVDVPPVVITTPPAPPVVVTPPPVVIVTPPVVAPTPTPTPTQAPEQPTVQLPVDLDDQANEVEAPLPTEPVAAPIDLPVLIGPMPGRTLDDGIRPAEPAALPEVPICDDRTDEPRRTPGNGKQHRRVHTTPTDAADKPPAGRPCPDTPGNPGQAINTLSVKPPAPDGQQLVADSAAGAYSRPVLHRLTQMRPRSDLPAGRTEHPEPGPA